MYQLKIGVIGFTKTAALEMAQDGITFNAIMPGPVRTELIEKLTKSIIRRWNK